MAYYTLFVLGPNDHSTYPECWGSTATSDGRKVAQSDTLAGLADAIETIGHNNWSIKARGKRQCIHPEDYRALLARSRRRIL